MKQGAYTKEKLFRLLFYLMRETDEVHGVTVNDMIDHLSTFEIHAERKSLYDDLFTLGALGFPVGRLGTRPERYYLEERVFEMSELKLLVDAIQSSKFVTKERSRALIEKLSRFAGRHKAGELSRFVYVDHRAKTDNTAVLETIDLLHTALRENRQISFCYFDYTSKKSKRYHRNGARYRLSPYALLWKEENYYLVAYDEREDRLKHFRVDKIDALAMESAATVRPEAYARFDPADYAGRAFAMYGGEEELVSFRCAERLAGVMIDRFGMEPTFLPEGDTFRFTLRVMLSPNFYAWVMSFGADLEILSPPSVRESMRARLDEVAALYRPKTEKGDVSGDV